MGEEMQAAVAAARRAQEMIRNRPDWYDRPTGPGLWLCMPDPSMATMKGARPLGMFLTADDIARGCPFYTPRVYGPIPEDKRDGE